MASEPGEDPLDSQTASSGNGAGNATSDDVVKKDEDATASSDKADKADS
ncbi:MAG: hypothetical protein ACI91J_000566, partial [Yoonia sp.]